LSDFTPCKSCGEFNIYIPKVSLICHSNVKMSEHDPSFKCENVWKFRLQTPLIKSAHYDRDGLLCQEMISHVIIRTSKYLNPLPLKKYCLIIVEFLLGSKENMKNKKNWCDY
jgi:hypothetical protein